VQIEKRLTMHPGEDAVTIAYTNRGSGPVLLNLHPLVCHKPYHGNFHADEAYPQVMQFDDGRTTVRHEGVSLVISHPGALRTPVQGWYYRFEHLKETERGLDSRDDLYCPCELRFDLPPGGEAILVVSTEQPESPHAIPPSENGSSFRLTPMLQAAAEPFLIDTPRHSILAGYPWFTDWGRDTMISLPGICLCTGRYELARSILRDYASQMRHGLIPNRFVESGEPETNTVDATLWFANAVYKTLHAEWDQDFARTMQIALLQVIEAHIAGTLHGIRMDPADGLITQGGPGLQLTWMDAKIGDWVVTPRTGKPVEIAALWINALRATAWISARLGKPGLELNELADRAAASFEDSFWDEDRGFYRDVVGPDDSKLGPNQVIAMSLPLFVPEVSRSQRALSVVSRDLLTPVGLRTLAPSEPEYRPEFRGPLASLDSAYHQGTVWPWLLGPYVTALMRYTGDRAEARRILRYARTMLSEAGIGGISEVYDGDEPRKPAGCPWQAWSVAEILRSWTEDLGGD
jgi:glycogen debranching enzyme